MSIVVVNKVGEPKYLVPAGGSILYNGALDDLSSAWAVDTTLQGVYVKGVDINQASDVEEGSETHDHVNPATTGSEADHTHPTGTDTSSTQGWSSAEYAGAGGANTAKNHNHAIDAATSSAGGGHAHGLGNTDTETVHPPYKKLHWIKAQVDALPPVGGILMWNDAIASAPQGFAICDGVGATPDMRDRFVFGAASELELGDVGGAETHVHGNSNTVAGGGHNHSVSPGIGGASATLSSGYSAGSDTTSRGGHGHNTSGTLASDSDHAHTVGDTDPASSLPVYRKLYYIQRTA